MSAPNARTTNVVDFDREEFFIEFYGAPENRFKISRGYIAALIDEGPSREDGEERLTLPMSRPEKGPELEFLEAFVDERRLPVFTRGEEVTGKARERDQEHT